MKIGIDIDDTITDTSNIIEEIIKKHKLPYKKEEYQYLPSSFWDNYAKEIYPKVRFKVGVREAFKWLKDNNIEIIIITAREYHDNCDMEAITKNIFKEQNIFYDKIIMNSIPKGPDAYKEKISLFIDDLEHNLESVSEYGIKCIKLASEKNNTRFKSFDNWVDVLEYIKKFYGEANV